jgi:hypothetical protein
LGAPPRLDLGFSSWAAWTLLLGGLDALGAISGSDADAGAVAGAAG